jgi:[acyl-carrier-protein] S-malonyltransferase
VAWEAVRSELPNAPVAFAGHSLGQVTALIAAGALPLGDGVRFAARRAELTQAAADRHPGRMAALLGATVEQAEDACAAAPDACWVANDNAPGQVVIAGTAEGLDRASARAREIGIRKVMPLNVGGAFHTPLMAEAADALREDVAKTTLAPPVVPVVSNDDGLPHSEPDEWSERLAPHVTVPVRWRGTQTTLAGLGATTFVEVGHGSMLAALAKRTVPEVSMCNVATPDDLTRLAEVH